MASKKLMIKDSKQYDKYKKSVENYAPLIDYIEQSNLKRNTKVSKITHLTLYCCSQDKYIFDLLNEAKREEKSIEELSERKIGKRLDSFEKYLEDEGYAEKTVRDRVKTVRSFYRRENITVPPKDLRPMINPKLREDIKNSEVFQNFIIERNLTNDSTIGGYLTSLTGYCDYYKMSIEELIAEAEKEELENVKLGKRKVKKRIAQYRNHLYEKKYSNKTVKSKMSDIIYFYVVSEITIPFIPKVSAPYDRGISFDEVPKKEHVKKAIETTTSIKNRAVYLFCMTSGSGAAEVREFTIEEYIRGVKDIPDNEDISDIDIEKVLDEVDKELQEALNTPQNKDESIIPVFHFVRKKKKRDYFTCITPEANQYIINYLKTREGLTLNDYVFDYTRKSLIRAFQSVNDKNKWGWVNQDRQRFFTSHQLRRLNANLIEDERLVNQIQGRKFDETTEAYFKRDKKKIRRAYFKWLDELTIYQQYRVNFMTDEKYARFAEELQKERDEKEQLKAELETLRASVDKRIAELDNKIKHFSDDKPIDVEVKTSLELFIRNLADENQLSYMYDENIRNNITNMSDEEFDNYLLKEYGKVQYILLHCDENIISAIVEIAYDIAMNEEKYDGTYDSALSITEKALNKLRDDEELLTKVEEYKEKQKQYLRRILIIETQLNEYLDTIYVTDEKEREEIINKIEKHLSKNKEIVFEATPNTEFITNILFELQLI